VRSQFAHGMAWSGTPQCRPSAPSRTSECRWGPMKIIGSGIFDSASSRWNSNPLGPGNLTSSTRHAGESGRSMRRNSCTDPNDCTGKLNDGRSAVRTSTDRRVMVNSKNEKARRPRAGAVRQARGLRRRWTERWSTARGLASPPRQSKANYANLATAALVGPATLTLRLQSHVDI
jgi:hypothetical protein